MFVFLLLLKALLDRSLFANLLLCRDPNGFFDVASDEASDELGVVAFSDVDLGDSVVNLEVDAIVEGVDPDWGISAPSKGVVAK